MKEKKNTELQEAGGEGAPKRPARRRWMALGASVCVLAVALACMVPASSGSGQGATTLQEGRPSPTTSDSSPTPSPAEETASAAASGADATEAEAASATDTEAEAAPDPVPADFTNSAIVGSSTTQGLYMYGSLPEPDYFYHTSLTLSGLYDTVMAGADKPILQALGDRPYNQIFLSFGLNELGWDIDGFLQRYGEIIDAIRAEQPQAVIYIESLLPVGPETSARNRFNVNQDRVNEFNAALEVFAPAHQCYFLDVSTELKDETGYLPDSISVDGIHLNQEGCAKWADLLRTRVTELLNSDAPPVVWSIEDIQAARDEAARQAAEAAAAAQRAAESEAAAQQAAAAEAAQQPAPGQAPPMPVPEPSAPVVQMVPAEAAPA